MFGRLGPTELVIILMIALVIFGPSKLPEIGKAVGKGLREFKRAAKDIQTSVDDESPEDDGKKES